MRRYLIFLVVVLLFSACTSNNGKNVENSDVDTIKTYLADEKFATDQYLEEYDIQRQFQTLTTGLCESENAFYSLSDDFIIYIDKQSGHSGVLCGKPECTHDTIDCNAQVLLAVGLTVYDHQLYWVGWEKVELGQASHLYLWRMNLDGTNREKVKQMDEELNSMLNGDQFVQIHRGYIYMAGGTSIVNKGVPSESTIVYAESMNSDEEPIMIINKEHFNEPSPHHRIQLIGNQLYIMISTSNGDGTCGLELYKWDSVTRELTTLFDDKTMPFYGWEMWVEEGDGIYITSFSIASIGMDVPAGVYKYDFATQAVSQCFEMKENDVFYIVADIADQIALICTRGGREEDNLFVKDFEGNILYNGALDIPELEDDVLYIKYFYGGNKENIYYLFENNSADIKQKYLIQIPLTEKADPVILWKEEK